MFFRGVGRPCQVHSLLNLQPQTTVCVWVCGGGGGGKGVEVGPVEGWWWGEWYAVCVCVIGCCGGHGAVQRGVMGWVGMGGYRVGRDGWV